MGDQVTCICNPYAEPNAERAPNCPVHGMVDLRKQVEELLAPHWISGRPREFAIVDAFPAIARHYLALLAERESAQAYILALRQMLYSNNPRFDVNDLASALEDLRQRTEEAGLALMDKQHADAKADAEIEEMWRQKVTRLEAENASLRKASALAAQHHAEKERLVEENKEFLYLTTETIWAHNSDTELVVGQYPKQLREHIESQRTENERLRKAVKAYMFVEQTDGGRNPHKPGTNKHTAFELGRDALARADAKPLLKLANAPLPEGCYCKPGQCMAPVIRGCQMPCRDPEKARAKEKP